MKTVAVILSVFNRKNVTLKGLQYLYASINKIGDGYHFDIYMTDDGSNDGTSNAVNKSFPYVHILSGDGNLYWSGGMRKAWQAAIDSGINYDFFMWFNDDAELYDDALATMFSTMYKYGNNAIISGVFKNKEDSVSYGGRDSNMNWILPDADKQVYYMNGNLVLIPYCVFKKLGNIDKIFIHGLGDWDYGLRALEENIPVRVSCKFVGDSERHDDDLTKWLNKKCSLRKRIQMSYCPKHNLFVEFQFNRRHYGLLYGVLSFLAHNTYIIFPSLHKS